MFSCPTKPFRMNTCKTVSKQRTLTQDCLLDEGCASTYHDDAGEDKDASHPDLWLWPDEESQPVTIGIGILCDDWKCGIVAADTRAIFGKTPVDPNDHVGKAFSFEDIPRFEKIVGAIAGRLGVAHDLVSQLAAEFKKVARKKHIYREHIQNAIDNARAHELRRRYDWALKANLGLSYSQLLRGRLPNGPLDEAAMKYAHGIMEQTSFLVEILIVGFLGNEPLIFRGTEKRDLEGEVAPSIYVIGSKGKIAALNHLNRRGQNPTCGLARSLLHVHEALKIARAADPKAIGKPSWYSVVREDSGQWRFDPNAYLLRDWASHYKDRPSTASLDSDLAKQQAEALLCKWEGHTGRQLS